MAIDLFSIGSFTIHGYGLMIGLGFLISVLWAAAEAKKAGLSADHITSIALWTLVIGVLGGKLLFIIVEFKTFISAPLSVLGSSGFVVYGGIITGVLTIIGYCLIKKISVGDYIDMIASFVPLNQAFGRVGCFLAGCCYGRETDAWYGVIFPEGCLAPAGVKLVPTQLIMAAGDLAIFIILYVLRTKKILSGGRLAAAFLTMYSVGRFAVEFLRNDYRGSIGFLSTSQFIALWIFAIGVIFLVISGRKHKTPVNVEEDFFR